MLHPGEPPEPNVRRLLCGKRLFSGTLNQKYFVIARMRSIRGNLETIEDLTRTNRQQTSYISKIAASRQGAAPRNDGRQAAAPKCSPYETAKKEKK